MKKRVNVKRAISEIALFVSAFLLVALMFHSCQKDEEVTKPGATVNTEEVGGRNGLIDVSYPQEPVVAATDFDITFSSTCGRIMLERGYTAEFDEYGILINKVSAGLTCDTENLLWEAVGEDVFENCGGATVTENLADPGTYVYRAKLNFKAKINSDCEDCEGFVGNQFECFMVTVVEPDKFTDLAGKKYDIVTIGNQTWMAENLAYEIDGSYVYGEVATYGRLYTWDAAVAACPDGWHLPSNEEWEQLKAYVHSNYGCDDEYTSTWTAWALAAPGAWPSSYEDNYDDPPVVMPYNHGCPGYIGCEADRSGFAALPAGIGYVKYSSPTFYSLGNMTSWWSFSEGDGKEDVLASYTSYSMLSSSPDLKQVGVLSPNNLLSVRYIKDPPTPAE